MLCYATLGYCYPYFFFFPAYGTSHSCIFCNKLKVTHMFLRRNLSLIFKSFSDATATVAANVTATIDATATASAANKTWIFK